MPTCVDGHTSVAEDFCDVCGSPIGESPPSAAGATVQAPQHCPACAAPISGRFCEACGHDSALPPPAEQAPPVVTAWTAVIAADRAFYQRVLAREGPDTVDFPDYFPERRILLDQEVTLIGRRNPDKGVDPQIDLALHPADRGVSTQHAVLRLRETGLTITDIGSTNGTSLNGSDDRLPEGQETPLADGDRIHVGAWTTITVLRS
ncbi:FHA domain-containing protein [Mycobacterium hackensackense]|uniref:FHA domain-containing protein n=1 Tax=Mycobacterium hackensackense TaxID=228909 RepID=UPI0022658061|nr:FHA domain-containing protein [Mycobacterium hackensackense]MCV7256383.1 FHA domain-containing protein [Mycobacterium hackensackense]